LTVKGGFNFGSGYDPSLLDQLPGEVKVYRARSIEPPYRAVVGMTGGDPQPRPPIAKRILRILRAALLIPDDKIGWIPFALRQGRRILESQKVDLIHALSPPPSSLLVAAILAGRRRLPLVVDFRDPWTHFTLHHWMRFAARRRIEGAMERAVLRRASLILSATHPRTEMLRDSYPSIPSARFETLTNGFDLQDFGPPTPPPRNDPFTLVYTGSIYYFRNPGGFLQALEKTLTTYPDMRDKVQVIFAGLSGPDLSRRIGEHGLEQIVKILGIVPYQQSIELQKEADLLLLFLGDSPMAPSWYPAKVFEYLATGRSILALAPEGITADLVREAGTGVVVSPEDVPAIGEAIRDLFLRWREGTLPSLKDPDFPARFERRALTARLVEMYGQVLASPTDSSAS
jgi:glycosyltransferase involved in cell wall biosynthesis